MKDPIDTVTHELPLPKKRGRPATGTAKTAAERKRAQRAREAMLLNQAFGKADGLTEISTAALSDELAQCISRGFTFTAQTILDELTRRVRAIEKRDGATSPKHPGDRPEQRA